VNYTKAVLILKDFGIHNGVIPTSGSETRRQKKAIGYLCDNWNNTVKGCE
jgi:hypothetical protein